VFSAHLFEVSEFCQENSLNYSREHGAVQADGANVKKAVRRNWVLVGLTECSLRNLNRSGRVFADISYDTKMRSRVLEPHCRRDESWVHQFEPLIKRQEVERHHKGLSAPKVYRTTSFSGTVFFFAFWDISAFETLRGTLATSRFRVFCPPACCLGT
jgi:hypothetical protein